ncbi:serine hydrolase [Bryobacterales bacterium F-183]|nr:serine hydrolase [Bryobacterales bacterium F-183]
MKIFPAAFAALACVALAGNDPGQKVRMAMEEMIAKNEIPGAVTVVVNRDRVEHLGVAGYADAANTRKLQKDSIFWIASMTKPVTAVAVLMMQDEGKLSINDPLVKYIPGFDPRITLKHMLTHTSGMGEGTPDELKAAKTLADLVPIYTSKPVAFEPGTQWKYCQSGINMLGRVVEIVSGQPLQEFFAARLFQPLGMKDTTFYPTEAQMPRIVTPAKRGEDGKLTDGTVSLLYGKPATATDRYPAANGGLYSTGPDYAKFAQMLLHGGTYKGKTYLSKAAFEQLTANQTGSIKAGFIPGHVWGLGVGVVTEPQGQTAMVQAGTFGHGGAYGTQAWIDPKSGKAWILMVQRTNFKNSDDSPVRLAFQAASVSK